MRLPQKPPSLEELMDKLPDMGLGSRRVLQQGPRLSAAGHYLHWDQFRRRPAPEGLSHREGWLALKTHRRSLYQSVPLQNAAGQFFQYITTPPIPERLHRIDLGVGGTIEWPKPISDSAARDRYYIHSLIEESITSSQLEGASTTRLVAKELLRSGRKPQDRSEQMILNNFRTMREIANWKQEELSPELLLEMHRLVTADTLDDPTGVGRLRRADEHIVVSDAEGTIYHTPPPAAQLEERLTLLCEIANNRIPRKFLHPVIRAIILHFGLAYDHPFVDGNGRTARALFYWSILRQGYSLFEFLSISHIILKAPAKYARAFLYAETDDNDLTYFILYHLDIIERAVNHLNQYVKDKIQIAQRIESDLSALSRFNHRQRAFLHHALDHPRADYTVEGHRLSHNVVYETARSDLMQLQDVGLLLAKKMGRTWHFNPAPHLDDLLSRLPPP